jgi:DNA (cytosine-5)-methyltransferase 1
MTLGVLEGARRANRQIDIRLAVDQAADVLAVYRANFPSAERRAIREDVSRIFDGRLGSLPSSNESRWKRRTKSIDLIVAGPPCQGHSDLNNKTRRRDGRNRLYLRVVRAAEVLGPKVVIIENVPTVLLDRQRVVRQASQLLRSKGYYVSSLVVNLGRFSLPQLRKRHFLVAVCSGTFNLEELDDLDVRTPTAGQYLDGLEDEPGMRMGLPYRSATVTEANRKRIEYLFRHGIHDLPDEMRPSCHRDKPHKYVSMYGRIYWDKPAQTITSGFGSMGQGRYVHPRRKRLLTPHEAARLQGIPDFFDFSRSAAVSSLREMIANAVPPQFTAVLVSRLITRGLL